MKSLFLASAVIMMLLLGSACQARRVGGACAYEEFQGSCVGSGQREDGRSLFSYFGIVRGAEVKLEENVADQALQVGSAQPCMLRFISDGTCTPRLLSMGSCGKEAWELFRAHEEKY